MRVAGTRGRLYGAVQQGLDAYHADDIPGARSAWEGTRGLVEVPDERLLLRALVHLATAREEVSDHALGAARASLEAMDQAAVLGIDVIGLRQGVRAARARADLTGVALGLPVRAHAAGIVYLHGFASSPASTKGQRFRAAFEPEGYGFAFPDLNEGDFGRLTLSRAILRVSRCLFDRTLLIGSSMGGYLSALAASRDDRVQGLVLMAPAFELAARLEARWGEDALARWEREGAMDVEHFGEGGLVPLDWGWVLDARQHPGRPRIEVPTYVLAGLRDEVVPIELIRDAVASNPHVVLDVVDDDHHLDATSARAIEAARRLAPVLLAEPSA